MSFVLVSNARSQPPLSGIHWCDSAANDRYGEFLFRDDGSAPVKFYIQSEIGGRPGHAVTVFLSPWGFVSGTMQCSRIPWPGSADSIDAVVFMTVNLKYLFWYFDFAAPQYKTGAFVAFLQNEHDSLRVFCPGIELNNNVFPKGSMMDPAGVLTVLRLGWVPLGGPEDQVLSVTMETDGIGAGAVTSLTREGFWRLAHRDLHPKGSIRIGFHGRVGMNGVTSLAGERTFQDVDSDGRNELVYVRTYSYGTDWRTECFDPARIVMSLTESGLKPTHYWDRGGGLTRIRNRLPVLVFSGWDGARFCPLASHDSSRFRDLDAMTRSRQVFRLRPRDWWESKRIPADEAMLQNHDAWASVRSLRMIGDSLWLTVQVSDSKMKEAAPGNRPAPRYDAALWFDTDLEGDFDDRALSNDDKLVLLSATGTTQVGEMRTFIAREQDDGRVFALESAAACRIDFSGEGYSFSCHLSLSAVGLNRRGDGPIVCGFAAEIVPTGTLPEQSHVLPLTQSTPSFYRFSPATWGNLARGIRRDTCFASQR